MAFPPVRAVPYVLDQQQISGGRMQCPYKQNTSLGSIAPVTSINDRQIQKCTRTFQMIVLVAGATACAIAAGLASNDLQLVGATASSAICAIGAVATCYCRHREQRVAASSSNLQPQIRATPSLPTIPEE
jgi:hypothetical protein